MIWGGTRVCILCGVKIINKKNITKAFNAMVITFAFSAMCHLLLVTIVALAKRDVTYLNPLDFLGVSILFPHLRNSMLVTAVGWLILALLFFTVLYVRIHYHLYVAIIREQKDKFSKTTKELSKKVLEKIS